MESTELILCPLTLRRDLFECSAEQYRGLLDVAVKRGYSGVSLGLIDTGTAEAAGISLDEFLAQFEERGLSTPVVDAISGWGQGQGEDEIAAQAKAVLDVASRAGAETVVAISMEATIPSVDVAAQGFARVCKFAADRGLKAAIEFFPWGGIPDISTVWEVVQAAGADNGGIVFDTWHWGRDPKGEDHDTLRKIPGDRIHIVQIDDAGPEPEADLMQETLRARRLPGDGVVNIVGALEIIREIGAKPIMAPEVFSQDLFALGADEMARQVADATRTVLTKAGWS
ncbi:MAG: sugar phosphate isomerase/epimerase [Candidatus Binatia bacterium]|nr:sugar phosphate isomerase/epimerase [Candidatus Binatia bacterium]